MTDLPRTPTFQLNGKRALVTGASRGIGLGGAMALAEHGAHVVMAARNAEEIGAAAKSVRDAGYSAESISLDVGDHAAMVSAIRQHGPFDILFNNAGTNKPLPYVDVTPENFEMITDLNLKAAFFVAQEVAKGMIESGNGGSIIHTSSQMGHVGGIDRSVYCGSKFGIEGVTKASAIELREPSDPCQHDFARPLSRTPMTASTFDNPERSEMAGRQDQTRPDRRDRGHHGRSRVPGERCQRSYYRHKHHNRWRLDRRLKEQASGDQRLFSALEGTFPTTSSASPGRFGKAAGLAPSTTITRRTFPCGRRWASSAETRP